MSHADHRPTPPRTPPTRLQRLARRCAWLAVVAPAWAGAVSVPDIQPDARRSTLTTAAGQAVQLVDLNPAVGAHYLLRVADRDHHLQLPPHSTLELTAQGLRYTIPGLEPHTCVLGDGQRWTLEVDRRSAFTPVCDGRMHARRTLDGWKQRMHSQPAARAAWSSWDSATRAAYEQALAARPGAAPRAVPATPAPPPGAYLAASRRQPTINGRALGIALHDADRARLEPGRWYPASHFEAVHASVVRLADIDPGLMDSYRDRVASLAANNGQPQVPAMVYLVALDLHRYTLNWVHGTAHPGVAWSRRHRLPRSNRHGPDGFAKLAPFVAAGAVSPVDLPVTIGTFSAGFQRRHGAFRWGELSQSEDAHHYGFVEDGVLLSALKPRLATLVGYRDGETDLLTWNEAAAQRFAELRHARQNGVPLIEGGGPDRVGIPGQLVGKWGPGNWSGSAERELRTPRSAACLVEHGKRRWLIYAYFASHTPSGMARVLQAYQCDYAVHLDMNSPGHAYFALFTVAEQEAASERSADDGPPRYHIEHLSTEMGGWDPRIDRQRTPRYLLKPEYKDFFYIMRRP